MTVKQLIEALSTENPAALVYIRGYISGEFTPIGVLDNLTIDPEDCLGSETGEAAVVLDREY